MKNVVYLVETQVSEWNFLRENLADFSLRCIDELRDVDADAKAVSVFIHSRVGADFLAAHPGVKLVARPPGAPGRKGCNQDVPGRPDSRSQG